MEMIAPGLLAILTPFIIGMIFGPSGIAGMVLGSIVAGAQLSFTFSTAGDAWENAKNYL
jgi:K(+)-stimulated pyrophosphate-energized sodium pump